MAAPPDDTQEAAAEAVAVVGEERLRNHRAARDRVRGSAELRQAAEHLTEPPGRRSSSTSNQRARNVAAASDGSAELRQAVEDSRLRRSSSRSNQRSSMPAATEHVAAASHGSAELLRAVEQRRNAERRRSASAATHTAAAASHGSAELRQAAEQLVDSRVRGGAAGGSRASASSATAPPARTRTRSDSRQQALGGAGRRSPSAASRRPRGIPRGPSRGEAASGHDLASAPHRQDPEDLEEHWQSYMRSEEYLTFQAVVDSLRSLPSMDQLTERRVDFEVLLHLLHRLGCTLEVEHVSKSYRAHYSPDVQLCGYLYSTLLTAFTLLPSYVLNGQEFYVSDTVLDQCKSLQFVFQETCTELKKQFEGLQSHTLEHIRNDVKRSLVYFDRTWCRFEMPALEEIEAIHRQACRPLIEAIEADQALLVGESKACSHIRGSGAPGTHRVKLQTLRTRLMEKLCELNRLANVDGKGRADMDLACVVEAERIAAKPMCMHLRKDDDSQRNEVPVAQQNGGTLVNPLKTLHKCSGCASPVLLRIARSLLRALARIRRSLQRYANCLYQLNSHLANNRDLVRGLELFESAWETANRYLVQTGPRRLALLTYDIVSGVQDSEFEAALNSLDPGFLVASLPRALIIHEMKRFAAAKAISLTEAGQAIAVAAPVKNLKGVSGTTSLPKIAMSRAAAVAAAMLPRPLDPAPRPSRTPSSPFQHSPIARAFLPEEFVDAYNEAATALERLPTARAPLLCSLLISPPRGSSGPTSNPPTSGGLKRKSTGGARAGTGGARGGTGGAVPPRTPCPPRMAVPNASRPESKGCTPRGAGRSPHVVAVAVANASAQPLVQAVAQSLTIVPTEGDESDEEDDDFTINLTAQIQNAELVPSPEQLVSLGVATEEALVPASKREGGQDPATRRVVSAISTLALHLQRSKPHEWNELIQVVLQGIMLAKSARTSSGTACGETEPANAARGPGQLLY